MLTIHALMLISLGFLLASLLGFMVVPAYRRRIVRLTTEQLRRGLPMTLDEIRAQKDQLRAKHAIRTHRLETQNERLRLSEARQQIEINRRDASISALETKKKEIDTHLKASENARRVLEQTIIDRIPTIEHRLVEARKLLKARDEDVAQAKEDSDRTFQALDEAMRINEQQQQEIDHLHASLAAQISASEDPDASPLSSPPAFETDLALRSELDELRTRSRNQATLITRLQTLLKENREEFERHQAEAFANVTAAQHLPTTEIEAAWHQPTGPSSDAIAAESLKAEIAVLKTANQELNKELELLKSNLAATQAETADTQQDGALSSALRDSKAAIRAKLRQTEKDARDKAGEIDRLNAELAAAKAQMANQARQHRNQLQQMGLGTKSTTPPPARNKPPPVSQPMLRTAPADTIGPNMPTIPAAPPQQTARAAPLGQHPADRAFATEANVVLPATPPSQPSQDTASLSHIEAHTPYTPDRARPQRPQRPPAIRAARQTPSPTFPTVPAELTPHTDQRDATTSSHDTASRESESALDEEKSLQGLRDRIASLSKSS